jgi:hypothetical protein
MAWVAEQRSKRAAAAVKRERDQAEIAERVGREAAKREQARIA